MISAMNSIYDKHVLATYSRFPITITKGKGTRVWDDNGKEYLDFCTGIAVCSLGHCHPRIVKAIQDQAAKLIHISNLYYNEKQGALAEEMNDFHIKLPGKIFFSNSGAEANDGLIKTARRYGHHKKSSSGKSRYEILTFTQSFHGRTLGSLAATGQSKVQQGFEPLLPGFRHLPFNDIEAVKAAVREETVAILLEPVQGEGGVHCASPEFLLEIDALCKKYDLLLMFDEVQSGFGRCGDPMAWRAIVPEIVPDAISWAKGMGNGVPIGAFWLSDKKIAASDHTLSSLMGAGSHGSTYGGNPLVSAASLETLKEIREKNLSQHAHNQGVVLRSTIAAWNLPIVKEIRGLGLLIGIEINPEKLSTASGETPAMKIVKALIEKGLLTVPAGPNTLRLLPPLNVSEPEVQEALSILKDTLFHL